jgi:hypothetical protein
LKVIGAVTQGMVKREELKRMREMGRPGMDGEFVEEEIFAVEDPVAAAEEPVKKSVAKKVVEPKKLSKRQRVAIVADKTAGFVLGNTVGRAARFVGQRVLGQVPETAKTSKFYIDYVPDQAAVSEPKSVDTITVADVEGQELLEEAIADQLRKDASLVVDEEDEALFEELYKDASAGTTKASSKKMVAST